MPNLMTPKGAGQLTALQERNPARTS